MSTPGIYYKVEIDSQIVKIVWDYKIYGKFTLNAHIIDLSGNQIYGVDYKVNCIDSSFNYVILNIPKKIKNLKIYLLARGNLNIGDYFIINNLYLFNIVKLNNLNMQIQLFDINKNLIKSYSESNIINQEFISYSFAEGCRWKQSSQLILPDNLQSGYYFIKINYGSFFYIPIIIKNKYIQNQVLILANTNTWNSYNGWAGPDGSFSAYTYKPSSIYKDKLEYKTKDSSVFVTNTLSLNRPNERINSEIYNYMKYDIKKFMYVSHLLYTELNLPLFLQENNINYDVITDMDLHTVSNLDISNYCRYKIMVLQIHPEYWSEMMIFNYNLIYNNKKTNLIYMGGNAIYWKILINLETNQIERD